MNQFIGISLLVGLVALAAFGILMNGFISSENEKKVNRMEERQKSMEQSQKEFQRIWIERQQNENKFNNETEHQMISLQRNASIILHTQIQNEKNLQGNLTNHRVIANMSYDKMFDVENATKTLANQTHTLLKFLVDNFGSQSGYIERENFQYKQANGTFDNTNKTLSILNNGTQVPK